MKAQVRARSALQVVVCSIGADGMFLQARQATKAARHSLIVSVVLLAPLLALVRLNATCAFQGASTQHHRKPCVSRAQKIDSTENLARHLLVTAFIASPANSTPLWVKHHAKIARSDATTEAKELRTSESAFCAHLERPVFSWERPILKHAFSVIPDAIRGWKEAKFVNSAMLDASAVVSAQQALLNAKCAMLVRSAQEALLFQRFVNLDFTIVSLGRRNSVIVVLAVLDRFARCPGLQSRFLVLWAVTVRRKRLLHLCVSPEHSPCVQTQRQRVLVTAVLAGATTPCRAKLPASFAWRGHQTPKSAQCFRLTARLVELVVIVMKRDLVSAKNVQSVNFVVQCARLLHFVA